MPDPSQIPVVAESLDRTRSVRARRRRMRALRVLGVTLTLGAPFSIVPGILSAGRVVIVHVMAANLVGLAGLALAAWASRCPECGRFRRPWAAFAGLIPLGAVLGLLGGAATAVFVWSGWRCPACDTPLVGPFAPSCLACAQPLHGPDPTRG